MICRLSVLMDEWNASHPLSDERLTQTLLSKKTGISYTTVNKLFHNRFDRIDKKTIETICTFLDCQVGDLLQLEDE
ncbi:MAG: hypothetical protein Kow00121_30430 [Elainellaceae cyanobacterium]